MSREPSLKNRVQAASVPEIKDEFEMTAKKVGRKVAFRGRKLRPGPLVNVLILNYLTLPEEEQVRIAAEGIARLEALLARDEPVDDLSTFALPAVSAATTQVEVSSLAKPPDDVCDRLDRDDVAARGKKRMPKR